PRRHRPRVVEEVARRDDLALRQALSRSGALPGERGRPFREPALASRLEMEHAPLQARVLEHPSGPLLVTAGPGTGKTAVLRERFARLIDEGAEPERVAMFVLSRRAARDARDVLLGRLRRSVADLPVFTVHGFAFRLLAARFRDLDYQEPPQV